jgi:F0F1-type ATP synthase assembly protein I
MSNIEQKKRRIKEVKPAKIYTGLYDEFSRLAHFRVLNGLDKKYNPTRVQKKALKHPLWAKVREDLKIAEFLDDDKAQFSTFNIFTFMIVAIIAVVFFGGLIYAQGLIYDVFHNIGLQNEATNAISVNMTQAAEVTFGNVNQSIQALRLVALTLILGIGIGIIITNALVKIHPMFFFVYMLISLLAIIFSVPISNAYYNLLSSGTYDGLLQSFTGTNWILLNLPLVVTIISVLGGMFLFINLIRTENTGVLQ